MDITPELAYQQGSPECCFSGFCLRGDFVAYLTTRVKDKFNDIQGRDDLVNEFGSLAKTGFEKNTLCEIFESQQDAITWRVGESISECYLEDYQGVKFYYEYNRDAKNPKGSQAGADLVGFVKNDNKTIFLFGEVKTSNDADSPPNVLYGRTGMTKQLGVIKRNSGTRNGLIRWLAFKVYDLPEENEFRKDFCSALKEYLHSKCCKYKIVGVLVRDTKPKEKDLKSRFESLKNGLHDVTGLELIALYLPVELNKLPSLINYEN